MAEPIYDESTEELYYSRVPELYRKYDADQDWQFKKYIASFGSQVDVIRDLLDRFWFATQEDGGTGYVPGADGNCDIANPYIAEEAWLPWMAQVLGIPLRGLSGDTDEEKVTKQRLWMSDPTAARRVGSEASLIQFGQSVLPDTTGIDVYPRTTSSGTIGSGGEWDVALTFRGTLSSDPAGAVIAAGQKPAGWMLYNRLIVNTWGDIEAVGTWGSIEAYGTWGDIQYGTL